ncbi:hypothetical protein AB0M44_43450 [Streptosporangium subroseum]|uniref:hypothetical protein n=1 Tax=Streptosporangium subroseum TaxID=106412 RepID=UPI00341F4661
MPRAIITFASSMPQQQNSGDLHPFVPCLEAKQGDELLLRAWVRLSWEASETAKSDLLKFGVSVDEAYARIDRALMLYGVRRMHQVITDHLSTNTRPDSSTNSWNLKVDDVTDLLQSAESKSCSFQVKHGRNLFCAAAGINDPTVSRELNGQRVAPTSTPLCMACNLPDDDYLCSSLIHPQVLGSVGSGMGPTRRFEGALCDKGQVRNVMTPHRCHAGGHSCWHKSIDVEPPAVAPASPLELAEAWDVLDAAWRLVFGKNKRLLSISSVLVPAAISLGCTTRVEFASRVGALADLIDRTSVGADLLPPGVKKEEIKGSIDALQRALLHKLPADQHQAIKGAVSTLRRVREVRNTMAHSISRDGGLPARLRDLGIYDAPPNWSSAWDAIRAHTAAALTIIRHELRRYDDNRTDT